MAETATPGQSVAECSPEDAAACERLIYGTLALTLEIRKGTLSQEQCEQLRSLLSPVLAGPQPHFALSVACWLRDRREIGNRLLPIHILVECARSQEGRLRVRTAAPKILLLPSDLSQAFGICRETGDGSLPSCLKKAGKDLLEGMTAFHAAKYDVSTKSKYLHEIVRKCDADLRRLESPSTGDGKGKGKGKKGKGKGKMSDAKKEQLSNSINKRRDEVLAKLKRLKAGDLKTLIRICHPEKNHELLMQMLKKRYPVSEARFALTGLSGKFEPDRAQELLRLQPPTTWERQCSKFGNVPTTWRDLLVPQVYSEAEVQSVKLDEGDDDEDVWQLAEGAKTKPPEVGMTALLRNMRNILRMGFSPGFLAKHVFRRIASGGGQPVVVLAQTLQQLKKDFTPQRLQEMAEEAKIHKTNIISCRRLQHILRFGPVASGSSWPDAGERPLELVEQFLGMPLMNAWELTLVGSVYLRLDRQTIRGGAQVVEHKRTVPYCPPDEALIKQLEAAFLQGIDRASKQKVPKISGNKQALIWLDLTPMPLQGGENLGLAKGEKHLCGLQNENVPAVPAGRQVPLEQILSSPLVNIELQYVGQLFIDYNLHAYGDDGRLLWESTWQECYKGGERRDVDGNVVVVHCRDVCRGTEQAPALRTLHIDLSRLEQEVFALAISSQCYTGLKPQSASVCLRELPASEHSELLGGTYREAFDKLIGGHDPLGASGALRGMPRLGASLTEALRASKDKKKNKKGKGKGKGKSKGKIEEDENSDDSEHSDDGKGKGKGGEDEEAEDDADSDEEGKGKGKGKVSSDADSDEEGKGKGKGKVSSDADSDEEGKGKGKGKGIPSDDSGTSDNDSGPSGEDKGGTCTYAVLYRDYKKGGDKWLFRNIMDECLESTTFVAVEINDVVSRICREAINAEAVLTVKDPNLTAQLRACQLRQAFVSGGGTVRCLVTGIDWGTAKPMAKYVDLKGAILEDIAALQAAQGTLMDRSLTADICLKSLAADFSALPVDVLARIGNVPELPAKSLPPALAGTALYALDMQGHLASRPELLLPAADDSTHVQWIPGGGESSVNMLRTLMLKQGDLVSFVNRFGPPVPPAPDPSSLKRAHDKSNSVPARKKQLVDEAIQRKATASQARSAAKTEQDRLDSELETCERKCKAEARVIENLHSALDAIRVTGKQDWERERSGDILDLKRKIKTREARISEFETAAKRARQQREVVTKSLEDASRDWRMQEDLLRSLEEEPEVTAIRHSLRCRTTGKTAMECVLGVGVRVRVRVGYDRQDMKKFFSEHKLDDEGGSESEEDEQDDIAADTSVENLAADSDHAVLRFMGATCRHELFSLDAFNAGSSKWSDSTEFEHFLPLALEGSDADYCQAVKGCLFEIQLAMKQAKQRWHSHLKRLEACWASLLEKRNAEDAADGKGKKGKGKGKGKKGKGKDVKDFRKDAEDNLGAKDSFAPRTANLPASEKYGGDDSTLAAIAVDVFPAVLNSVLVEYVKDPCDDQLQFFCALHSSFGALVRGCPALKELVALRVRSFAASPEGRLMTKIKDIGQFLQLLLVSGDDAGPEVWVAAVEELLVRMAVAYAKAKGPDEEEQYYRDMRFGKGKGKGDKEKSQPYVPRMVQEFGSLVLDKDDYLKSKWELSCIGCRIALFTQLFADEIRDRSTALYYGRMLSGKRRRLEKASTGIDDWPKLAAKLRGFPEGPILPTLQSFIQRARDQDYFPSQYHTVFEKTVNCSGAVFNKQADEVQVTGDGEIRGQQHALLNLTISSYYKNMNFGLAQQATFHIKILEHVDGSELRIGWSCVVGDKDYDALLDRCSNGKGKGGMWHKGKGKGKGKDSGKDDTVKPLSLVMDLESKSGVSASYSATGALHYGDVAKEESSFGPGDVVTCTFSSHEERLTASFAVNGKTLSSSGKWQIADVMAVARQLSSDAGKRSGDRFQDGRLIFIPTVSGANFKVRLLSSTCSGKLPAADMVSEQRVLPGFTDENLVSELSESFDGELPLAKLSFLRLTSRACEWADAARRAKLVGLGLPVLLAQRLLEVPQGGASNTEARKMLLGSMAALAGKDPRARDALGTVARLPEALVTVVRSGTSEERQLGASSIEALGQDDGPLRTALLNAGCVSALVAVLQQAEVTMELQGGAACKALGVLITGDVGDTACTAAVEAGMVVPVLHILRKGNDKAKLHAMSLITASFGRIRKELEENDFIELLIENEGSCLVYDRNTRLMYLPRFKLLADMVGGDSAKLKKAGTRCVREIINNLSDLSRGFGGRQDKEEKKELNQARAMSWYMLWVLLRDTAANQNLALERNGVQVLADSCDDASDADGGKCFAAKALLLLAEKSDVETDKALVEGLNLKELAASMPDDASYMP